MNSLRDQLLKVGVVSKKDRRRVDRELKEERKKKQGKREARAVVERRRRRETEECREERRRLRSEDRAARLAIQEEEARRLQVTHILRHHAIRLRPGPQRFWHRSRDGRRLQRLDLPQGIAWDLRAGRLAVAWLESTGDEQVVLVPREPAERVQALRPEHILHLNLEPPPEGDPSERLIDTDVGS